MEVVIVERELLSSHYGFDGWAYARRGLILRDDTHLTEEEFQEADCEGNA